VRVACFSFLRTDSGTSHELERGLRPLSPIRRFTLKPFALGLCALFLFAAPAAAHEVRRPAGPLTLAQRLAYQRAVVRHDRHVVSFFQHHRWMLARYNPYRPSATRQLQFHRSQLRWTTIQLLKTQHAIELRNRRLLAARLRTSSPVQAIRRVFGAYWQQALAVARCESGLSVWAQNGQYLGLFQMGSSERSLYGHGATPYAQAIAAHRYFLASGRDWSPWQCKPW
jgi:hypothetical protein